jgi:hypothetical protein
VQRAVGEEIFFPHFPRGLRHRRYFSVALRGFVQRAEGEEIFFPHFTRGLRHHRYFSVALRGF